MSEHLFSTLFSGLTPFGRMAYPPSAQISETSMVGIGFECLDRDVFDPSRTYEKLGKSGVKHARCQTGWAKSEPRKGVYQFDWLDKIVDGLLANGVSPWFNLGYGNPLYMPDASGPAVGFVPLYYGEECRQAWLAFVQALTRHFEGRITHFEVWNEPDGMGFWHPVSPDPVKYAELVTITSEAIKKVMPSAKIGACSACAYNPDYHGPFFRTGVAKSLDFFCVHAYRLIPELHFASELAALKRQISTYGGEHLELWQGEAGFPSFFPPNHWLEPCIQSSQTMQAKWLLRRMTTDFSLGLKRSSFFQMVDMVKRYEVSGNCQARPARHGILDGDTYQEKESYWAIRSMAALFDGGSSPVEAKVLCDFYPAMPKKVPQTRLPALAAVRAAFQRHGRPLLGYYVPEDIQQQMPTIHGIDLWYDAGEFSNPIENPILIDPLTGWIAEVPMSFEGSSVKFPGLPITDYPLFLTDAKALATMPN